MAKRTSHLTKLDQISVEERKLEGKERERKKREEEGGERSSTISLDLTVIGPLAFVGTRCKVHPRDEGFA